MDWSTGDFTSGGKVDINDLSVVLTNYHRSVGAATGGLVAVPEPGTLTLLGVALTGLLVRAWRKRR
jgi:hypothetical protein